MIDREALELVFTWAAAVATAINAYGIWDAWKTLAALRSSELADDANAYLIAKGGIRTACIRTVQMICLWVIAVEAGGVDPRPHVSAVLSDVWRLLTAVCVLSSLKEVLAMRDRRRIVVTAVLPFETPFR